MIAMHVWWGISLGCRKPEPIGDTGTDPGPLGRVPPALDLAALPDGEGLRRLYGSALERGSFGVPVAGGGDVDGDGAADVALSAMRASPEGREHAGLVWLSFGDGTASGAIDSATDPDVLAVWGVSRNENAGSEIWMDDVTGDGLADLLVARQNATIDGALGGGAVSVVFGDPALRALAGEGLDLASPDHHLTLGGSQRFGRLGIWVRTGDATGDGVADLLIGADQEDGHLGAVYLVEGGPWLGAAGTVTVDDPGPLAGHILRIAGETGIDDAHFGATVQLGDLDGNGRAELLVASTVNRAGAGLPPDAEDSGTHGRGGVPHGRVTVIWDDVVGQPPWSGAVSLDHPAGAVSRLTGGWLHNHFGEELVGGFDWDGDGAADLFAGDLVSDLSPGAERPNAGVGVVFWGLGEHRGEDVDLRQPPPWLRMSVLLGADAGDLFSDTAGGGDFDGDGRDDLVITSPDAEPDDRRGAGRAVILYGGTGRWPREVDTRHDRLPQADRVRLVEIWGAQGTRSSRDYGDMLAYSAAVGDIDGDGLDDLIANEMLGNGLQPGTEDVGNLDVISGAAVLGAERRSSLSPR